MTEKDGATMIDQIAEHVTLDEYLHRNPRNLSEDDLQQIVKLSREERAAFIQKKEEKE